MAAPILWTPGKNAFFLQENLHVRKIRRFGGGILGLGGGECRFYFYGRGDFSEFFKDLTPNPIIEKLATQDLDAFEIELHMIRGLKLGMGIGCLPEDPFPLRVTRMGSLTSGIN